MTPMSSASADAEPGTAVVPYARPEPPMLGLTGLVRRVTDLGLGAASLAAGAAVDALERFVPADPSEPDDAPLPPPGVLRHLPGALVGAGLVAQRHLLDATEVAERGLARAAGAVSRTPVVGAPVRATETYLAGWSGRAETEQARNRALVGEFVRRLAPELATAVVQQLDVETLIEQLPIDAVLARVDLDALLLRIDLDALLDRIDVGAIMDRVDVGKIMSRVDIAPIANEVLDEVDIGAIVRESTGSITGDMVDGGRVTAMRVDDFVARVVDRVLFRRTPRRIDGPGAEEAEEAAEPV